MARRVQGAMVSFEEWLRLGEWTLEAQNKMRAALRRFPRIVAISVPFRGTGSVGTWHSERCAFGAPISPSDADAVATVATALYWFGYDPRGYVSPGPFLSRDGLTLTYEHSTSCD